MVVRRNSRLLLVCCSVALVSMLGCDSGGVSGNGSIQGDAPRTVSETIGNAGGEVQLGKFVGDGALKISFDSGVLSDNTAITVEKTQEAGEVIDDGVTVAPIAAISGVDDRTSASVLLEMPYDESLIPDGIDEEDLCVLTRSDDGEWEMAGGFEVDVASNIVRGRINHFSEWTVSAPPSGWWKLKVDGNVSPTYFNGLINESVAEPLVIEGAITPPSGYSVEEDDVQVTLEFYSVQRILTNKMKKVWWGTVAPSLAEVAPNLPEEALSALEDSAFGDAWRHAVTGQNISHLSEDARPFQFFAQSDGSALVLLTLSPELLTAMRSSDTMIYRIDVQIVANSGRLWDRGESALFSVYLFSPKYVPVVTENESNSVYSSPPNMLGWSCETAPIISNHASQEQVEGFTVVISDEGDPYADARWRFSTVGARKPSASERSYNDDRSFDYENPVNDYFWEQTEQYVLKIPDDVREAMAEAQADGDVEYRWAVISQSPQATLNEMQDYLVSYVPETNLQDDWDRLDPDRDTDGDGEADWMSDVFSFVIEGESEEVDTDGDGVSDEEDGCEEDSDKTEPGECGCGVSDIDTDSDGMADCVDECPDNPDMQEAGECGCDEAETCNVGPLELGSITSASQMITLAIGAQSGDGDRVKLSMNGVIFSSDLTLTSSGIQEQIDLEEGENVLEIEVLETIDSDDVGMFVIYEEPERTELLNKTWSLITGQITLIRVNYEPVNEETVEAHSWSQQDKLIPGDNGSYDRFGFSVSISGDTAIIGAPDFYDNNSSAYIFRYDGSTWTQQSKLISNDALATSEFGRSVSISGDTALIGACRDFNDGNGTYSGSAYVFHYDGSAWVQQAKLTPDDGAGGDCFGRSVSISGDTALIGAYEDDDNGTYSGSAYVFRYDGSAWVQQAKLTASDGANGDKFGMSVSVSDSTALIGAFHDDDKGRDSGSAYVFHYDGFTWAQQAKLTASDGGLDDGFGGAVSISGATAVIGASDTWQEGPCNAAYVFRYDGSTWIQDAKLAANDASSGDEFGQSVSISGETVVVGANYDDDNGSASGSAYVFRYDGTAWVQCAKLTADDGSWMDHLGSSVSVSGDTAIIGAYANNDNGEQSGSAYVFAVEGE